MTGVGERRPFWRTALLVLMVAAATSVQSRGQRSTNCGLTCYRSWGIVVWNLSSFGGKIRQITIQSVRENLDCRKSAN